MNVMHLLTGGDIGGIESLCREYADYSNNKNIFVMLKDICADNAKHLLEHGHIVIQLGISKKNMIKGVKRIKSIIKEYKIEAIVTHHASPILHILMQSVRIYNKKIKRISYAHGNALNMVRYGEKKGLRFRKKVLSWSLRKSDSVIAISDSVKESLVDYFKTPEKKIKVIYNGINISRFNLTKKGKNQKAHIIYVGRLVEGKGVQIILKALSLLPKELAYHFTIVGDGEYKSILEELTSEYKLIDNVEFVGRKNNIEEYIIDSDIFIHVPLFEEGFGITIVEAMAGGLICICSRSGGIPEIIEDKVNGYLIQKNDSEMLAERLEYVIKKQSSEELNNIIVNAKERAKKYDITEFAKALDNHIGLINK